MAQWSWQNALSGATTGAGIGAYGGPWGAGAGAGIGALMGLLKDGGDKKSSPELDALIERESQKIEQANPLYEAVMQLAYDRLPANARGPNRPVMSTEPMAPLEGDPDDFAQSPAARRLLHLQSQRMQMADPVIQAIQNLAKMRMPRGYPGLGPSYVPPDGPAPDGPPPIATGPLPPNLPPGFGNTALSLPANYTRRG